MLTEEYFKKGGESYQRIHGKNAKMDRIAEILNTKKGDNKDGGNPEGHKEVAIWHGH
jgi:hypothetical protein